MKSKTVAPPHVLFVLIFVTLGAVMIFTGRALPETICIAAAAACVIVGTHEEPRKIPGPAKGLSE